MAESRPNPSNRSHLTLESLEKREVPSATVPCACPGGPAPPPDASALYGSVYEDTNSNGKRDAGEPGIEGVTITLTGTTSEGQFYQAAVQTSNEGFWGFDNIPPGTYSVTQTQPAGYLQGTNSVGHVSCESVGQLGPAVDQISNITLLAGEYGCEYDFGETTSTPPRGGTEGLTPGFWRQPHHSQYWVGFKPTDSFEGVFGVDVPGVGASFTLLDALTTGGGGYQALNRQAVAALLNGANSGVDYAYSSLEVIQLVQEAYATKNYDAVKNVLESENEKGADIKSTSVSPPVAPPTTPPVAPPPALPVIPGKKKK